jgi:c-di-GMP-binding flagellar brake protein YcgR
LNWGVIIPVLSLLVLGIVAVRLFVVFQDKIQFFSKGLDQQFRFSELRTLWSLGKKCELEEPISLFYSVPTINKCIGMIITESRKNLTYDSPRVQLFLDKLYKFRTRVALDAEGKKNIENTKYLDAGQKLTVILPGKGVFVSKILNNASEMVISLPTRFDKKTQSTVILSGENWAHQMITLFFWRKGDAMYSTITQVNEAGVYQGDPALFVKHSNDLVRNQKRQSIRSECEIYAQMYVIKTEQVDYSRIDKTGGYRCLLEDISEDGALVRIGGKGIPNVMIKLQFKLEETFIMMFGIVRAVEYDAKINQSRLHFECKHIEPVMRNAVLQFVYKVIPDDQKEIQEAIKQTEEDIDESEEIENDSLNVENDDAKKENQEINLNNEDDRIRINDDFIMPETKSNPEDEEKAALEALSKIDDF